MPTDDLLDAVAAVGGALADLIERLPAEVVHRRAAAAEWSIAEIGGHCAEFPVFQARQAGRIAVSPGVRFGRREDDADRLAAAARFGRAAPAEIAAAVRAAVAEAPGDPGRDPARGLAAYRRERLRRHGQRGVGRPSARPRAPARPPRAGAARRRAGVRVGGPQGRSSSGGGFDLRK